MTDVAGEMIAKHAQEDPLEYGKTWGMIQGNNVRVRSALAFPYSYDTNEIVLQRRTGGRPPVPAPAQAPAPLKATIPAKRPVKEEETPQPKKEPEDKAPKTETTAKREEPPASKPTEKTAPPKQKGSIFSSFAKAKPKQKKEESATPATSAAESVSSITLPEFLVLSD